MPLALHKTNLAEVMMVYANFSQKSTSLQRHLNKNIKYDCTANPVADVNQGTAEHFYLCSTFCLVVSVNLLEASSVLGADNRKLFKNL